MNYPEIKELAFYNNYHSGDCCISRNWVKWLVAHFKVPATYYHLNSDRLLIDCPINIVRSQIADDGEVLKIKDGKAIFNTWYNAGRGKYFKTCSIQSLDTMFRTECKEKLGLDLPPIEEFIPSFDWSYYDTKFTEEFISDIRKQYDKVIMVCNNNVLSGQSENFDMMPIVDALAEKFPNYYFIITNWVDRKMLAPNVWAAWVLTEQRENLPELGFLGSLCDFVIHRNSGPATYSINTDSLKNGTRFISICNEDEDLADFGLGKLRFDNFSAIHNFNEHIIIEELIKRLSP